MKIEGARPWERGAQRQIQIARPQGEGQITPRHDRFEWSGEIEQAALGFDRVQAALDRLQEAHPQISFEVCQSMDQDELRQVAASLGTGKYLLLSESFLQQMQNSEEEMNRGLERIARTLARLEGVDAWPGGGALCDQEKDVLWKLNASREEMGSYPVEAPQKSAPTTDFRQSANLNALLSSPSRIIARIASAKSVMDVQGTLFGARRAIGALNLAGLSGDEKTRNRIRTAVRRLERAVRSGNEKVGDLQRIQLAKKRKQRAEEQMQRERARREKAELEQEQDRRARKDHRLRSTSFYYEAQQHLSKVQDGSFTDPSLPLTGAVTGGVTEVIIGGGVEVTIDAVVVSE